MGLGFGTTMFLVLVCGIAVVVTLVLHARLQDELQEIARSHKQASEQLKRVQSETSALRGELEKFQSKLTATREYLSGELTKALAPPAKRITRRGGG